MDTEPIDINHTQEFGLSNEIKGYLKETSKWAKFIAILGFVGVGFMIIGAISVGIFMSSMSSEFSDSGMPFPPALLSLVYLIMAAVMAVPIYFLYQFATKMQRALRTSNAQILTESFKNLKSHYKFYGILMAIFIGFYLIILIIAILGGAAGFMAM